MLNVIAAGVILRLLGRDEHPVFFAARLLPFVVLRSGVGSAITALLVDVVRCARKFRARSRSPWLQRLLDHIEANLDKPLRIGDIAGALGISESYVKHRFAREMGLSPADHVLRCRIERAKSRLADPKAPVTQIAMDLGFSTSQHFSTAFRRYVGRTPASYRRIVCSRRDRSRG